MLNNFMTRLEIFFHFFTFSRFYLKNTILHPVEDAISVWMCQMNSVDNFTSPCPGFLQFLPPRTLLTEDFIAVAQMDGWCVAVLRPVGG